MTDLSCRTMDSPRFEHSTLCYYVGDTFQLLLPIELTRDGEPVTISDTDTVTVTFVDQSCNVVVEKRYTGIKDNTIMIDWNEEMSAKFVRGWYRYRIRYNGENVTTIAADCRIYVQ